MTYLFILLLNFFLNGSSSSIEIANFLRIFKFLATFLFNVLLASSLNVSHIQYPVIALCPLLPLLQILPLPLLYSLCNTFSVPTFFHFLPLLEWCTYPFYFFSFNKPFCFFSIVIFPSFQPSSLLFCFPAVHSFAL